MKKIKKWISFLFYKSMKTKRIYQYDEMFSYEDNLIVPNLSFAGFKSSGVDEIFDQSEKSDVRYRAIDDPWETSNLEQQQ
jgi:hypothetical protein